MVINKRVDLAGILKHTEERSKVIDFTHFVYMDGLTLLMHPTPKDIWSFAHLFQPEVWMLIVLTSVLFTVFYTLFIQFSVDSKRNCLRLENNECPKCGQITSIYGTFRSALQYCMTMWLIQGTNQPPKLLTLKLLVSSLMFIIIIVISTYSGNLLSSLTVSKNKLPFKTLQEFAHVLCILSID